MIHMPEHFSAAVFINIRTALRWGLQKTRAIPDNDQIPLPHTNTYVQGHVTVQVVNQIMCKTILRTWNFYTQCWSWLMICQLQSTNKSAPRNLCHLVRLMQNVRLTDRQTVGLQGSDPLWSWAHKACLLSVARQTPYFSFNSKLFLFSSEGWKQNCHSQNYIKGNCYRTCTLQRNCLQC